MTAIVDWLFFFFSCGIAGLLGPISSDVVGHRPVVRRIDSESINGHKRDGRHSLHYEAAAAVAILLSNANVESK